ncbi:MAG: HAD-IG family 5'-nucleotidase [Rhodothermales bacterium]|nr:HAD-IG family 5'-nucleotidase [Rhodothermales bacterium]
MKPSSQTPGAVAAEAQVADPSHTSPSSAATENYAHGLFCNRTLNLRSIQAIGYDMDYTLIHYRMSEWENRAYDHLKSRLLASGWPVEHLRFDPDLVTRGLIIDTARGNIVKANRFGYVKNAFHGTRPIDFETKKELYRDTLVDLSDPRWSFMNTLFSISEACMYMQVVDLMDQGAIEGMRAYNDLYHFVRRSLDEAHVEGRLKSDIMADPDRYVELDEHLGLTLLDQKHAGKKLLLITNSEWSYTAPMMSYVLDPYLPGDMTWEDLFDIKIVAARKPDFFTLKMPTFEVVDESGVLRSHVGKLEIGGTYVGGNAVLVEESLGLAGEEILYVGDHIFADVNVSKNVNRWRTALIVRELEDEIRALANFRDAEQRLSQLMEEKERLESEYSHARVLDLRSRRGYSSGLSASGSQNHDRKLAALRARLVALDEEIAPLARSSAQLVNPNWGPLMRTGKDKSHLARQIERYADIYTSRVSNFLRHTPFIYLRAHRGSLPHDTIDEVGAYI